MTEPSSEVSAAPSADLEWCHEAVQGVSRTFALTVDELDEPMASEICLGYLLCRVADTIEDSSHVPPADQVRLLSAYDAVLDPEDDATIEEFRRDVDEWIPPSDERSADWAVVANAPTVWATFAERADPVRRAIVPPVREMVTGMATFVERYADVGGLRIADCAELEDYCHFAAGTVGTLVTNLLLQADVDRERTAVLEETAEGFGLLLQLTNVSKDVHDDFVEENNVYLPADWLAEEGVAQDAVLDPANRDGAAAVVGRTATHARTFLDDAQTYLEALPLVRGNTLAAWSVPYLLSVGTLRELGERPGDALTGTGVKVSRQEVFAVVEAARRSGRESLGELRTTIEREPFHRA